VYRTQTESLFGSVLTKTVSKLLIYNILVNLASYPQSDVK